MGAHNYVVHWSNGRDFFNEPHFSMQKVYNALTGDAAKVPWRKIICNYPAPPKCIFVGWLAVLDRLATCDRIRRFGVVCDLMCVLCTVADENRNHLFFECSFSAEI